MNRTFYVDALAMAERHIAQGIRIILNQRRIIAELEDRGADATIANDLLVAFLTSQQLHEDDRRRFEIEIAKLRNEGCR